ncbi:MAG: AAA family ATPase [Candidatus Eisenbacteria bacterium]
MFERHFGLRENPFQGGHQLRFLYPSREHQEARAHLRYGIENREPFLLITGEVGTGKTTAIYDALAEWGSEVSVALITNSALTRQELLEEIGLRFGMSFPSGVSKPQALVQLERHLLAVRQRGAHAVLLLDEAQNLAPELLEEIRLLSNLEEQGDKLLQIFLVGQPELEAKLAKPELRQLRQRITVHYRLNPLSPEETAGYIHHRISVAGGNAWVVFPPDACREVFRLTHGIPREINTVASAALLTAFAEGANSVRPEHVQSVAEEAEFRSVLGEATDTPELKLSTPTIVPSTLTSTQAPYWTPPARPVPPPTPAGPRPEDPAARSWTEPEESGSAPRSWGSEPKPQRREPVAPLPPAWQPPVPPAPGISTVEKVEREEIDAWSTAARDLLEARRKQDANPAPAAPIQTEPSAFSGLSPRLRDKLAAEVEVDDQPRNRTLPILLLAAVLAVLGVSSVLMQRFGIIDLPVLRGIAGSPPTRTPIAPTDSLRTDTGDSLKAPLNAMVPATSGVMDTSRARQPASKQIAVVRPTAGSRSKPVARPDTLKTYALAVGTYMDEERAKSERDRMSANTGLSARLIPYHDSGVTMYRLVLGSWSSRSAAEIRASQLVQASQVNEARVLVLGRGSIH